LLRLIALGGFAIGWVFAGPPTAAVAEDAPAALSAERVVVLKSQRQLVLLRDGEVLKSYRVALGRNPIRPKVKEGDGRTPEGRYIAEWRNPDSRFHRAIRISYPNWVDRHRAWRLQVKPGHSIMIHGLPNGRQASAMNHPHSDWTDGCIAVTNAEMDEIWAAVELGTPIEIRP
jgi:murein L,D-transpeptidase YafK